MNNEELKKQYEKQQTPEGQKVIMLQKWMKHELCTDLKIPMSAIQIGVIKGLKNEYTNEIDRFIIDD